MKQKGTIACSTAVLLLLMVVAGLYAQTTFEITSLLRPGEDAPVPSELVLASAPSLNDEMQVAFTADGAVFLASEGKQRLIAGFGEPAPGGGTFVSASFPSINARGEVAFVGSVSPPSRSGIFLFSEDRITQVVRDGDAAPGGGTLTFLRSPALNAEGQVAFSTSLGIFLSSKGTVTKIARLQEPAPGGGAFIRLGFPALNNLGQVAFAGLAGTGSGIFLFSEERVTRIAATGDPFPGGGTLIVPTPSLNDQGQVAFESGRSTTPGGIFLFSEGRITRIIQAGSPAPGGGTLTSVSTPSLNAKGQVAFIGFLSTSGSGVFLLSNEAISKIARPGDTSPEKDRFASAAVPSLNSKGQVAFLGRLNDQVGGVYLGSDDKISRVAGQGDPLDRDPKFYFAAPESINGKGKVAIRGNMFPGSTGLFDDSINLMARTGDPAPGGNVFVGIFSPSINDNGEVSFYGNLSTGSTGVFLFSEGKLYKIVRSGDTAPGGGTFLNVGFPSLNNMGQVAFDARVSGTAASRVFLFSEGTITKLVAQGDPAPGVGSLLL